MTDPNYDSIPYFTEEVEIDLYLDRFRNVSADEKLQYLTEMMDFVLRYMPPEGRKSLDKPKQNERLEDKL